MVVDSSKNVIKAIELEQTRSELIVQMCDSGEKTGSRKIRK
jgi:hypothetical protein